MEKQPTPKMKAACEMLEYSLRAYFERAYFASLHLAGAAEEVLGTYVTREGLVNAFTSMKDGGVGFSGLLEPGRPQSTEKEISKVMVYAKNRTKHIDDQGDDNIHFVPQAWASDTIERAIDDYFQLMTVYPLQESELMRQFHKEVSAKISMKEIE